MVTGLLHAGGEWSMALVAVVAASGVGTALLMGLSTAAFRQRQSRSYLLLAGAFAALFGRSVVAAGTMMGVMSSATHHLLEHGIDVVVVGLIVAAVYYTRSVSHEVQPA